MLKSFANSETESSGTFILHNAERRVFGLQSIQNGDR